MKVFKKKMFIYVFGCAGSYLRHLGSLIFIVACKIFSCSLWDLVLLPGIEPWPPALGAQSLSHWTTREVPPKVLFKICMCAKSLQSCVSLCDPMDCNPPGSSVHGVLQARILEWVAVPSS